MSKKKKFQRSDFKKTTEEKANPQDNSVNNDLLHSPKDSLKVVENKLSLFCSRAIEYLWLAALILIPLIFWPNFSLNLAKEVTFDFLVLVMLFFYLIRIVLLKKINIRLNWLTILLCLLLFSIILSTIFSPDPIIGFWGSANRNQGLKSFLLLFIFLLILIAEIKYLQQVVKIKSVLIWTALALSVYAILQYFGIDPLPQHREFSEGTARIRAYSTFGNPVMFAGWLAIIIPLIVERIWQRLKKMQYSGKFKFRYDGKLLLYSLVLFTSLSALFLTYSRGAILALVISIFLSIVLVAFIKKIRWLKIIALLFLMMTVLPIVSLNLDSNPLRIPENNLIAKRFSNILDQKGSFYTRTVVWKNIAKPIKDRWLLGYGPDGYEPFSLSKDYYSKEMYKFGVNESRTDRAHNIILDNLLFFGALATMVFLILIIVLIYRLARSLITSKDFLCQLIIFNMLLIFILQNLVGFAEINNYILFFIILLFFYKYNFSDLPNQPVLSDYSRLNRKKIAKSSFLAILLCAGLLFTAFYWLIARPVKAEFYSSRAQQMISKPEKRDLGKNYLLKSWQLDSRNYRNLFTIYNLLITDKNEHSRLKELLDQANAIRPLEITYPYLLANYYFYVGVAENNNDYLAKSEQIINQSLDKFGYQVTFYIAKIDHQIKLKNYQLDSLIEEAISNTYPIVKDYYVYVIQTALDQNDFEQTLNFISNIKDEKIKQDVFVKYLTGVAYYQKKDFNQAIKSWDECNQKNPNYLECPKAIAISYMELRKYDRALEYIKKLEPLNVKLSAKLMQDLINKKSQEGDQNQ